MGGSFRRPQKQVYARSLDWIDWTDWQPGQRHEDEEEESAAEVGERDHLRMQWRWKREKQLEQDQIGEERRTMS